MNEEEFFNRMINKIAKDYGYDVASTLKLMFLKKEKQLADIKFYIEQSDIKNMLWGKEILKIIGDDNK